MAHEIDQSTGRDAIAFTGERDDIWHRLGNQMQAGQSTAEWRTQAGLNWECIKVPAFADMRSPELAHLNLRGKVVENASFLVRTDTGGLLGTGTVSDGYHPHQPADVLAWFERYTGVDERFHLSVAGALRGGSIIWATAEYNGAATVAGDAHRQYLLMTTSYDTTMATINRATTVRVVCKNTLNASHFDSKCEVRTRHNTPFDPAKVAKELAAVAGGFNKFKQMGDAMAQCEMTRDDVKNYFKQLLGIPVDAAQKDISTRKIGQYEDLWRAFTRTQAERNSTRSDVWTAVQAVTRYVDHDRTIRDTQGNALEARAMSSQFGSGAAMKAEAVNLIMPRIKALVAA